MRGLKCKQHQALDGKQLVKTTHIGSTRVQWWANLDIRQASLCLLHATVSPAVHGLPPQHQVGLLGLQGLQVVLCAGAGLSQTLLLCMALLQLPHEVCSAQLLRQQSSFQPAGQRR